MRKREWSGGIDWHAWNVGFTWYPGNWGQIYFGPLFFGWSYAFPLDEF